MQRRVVGEPPRDNSSTVPASREVGAERGLDSGQAGWLAVSVVDETGEVRRADHVEVEHREELSALALAKTLYVGRGAHEPELLRAPESEAKPAAGRTSRRRACRATSSTSAEPDPLSLIPGPFATESRWAPSSTAPGLRPGSSAITFFARAGRVDRRDYDPNPDGASVGRARELRAQRGRDPSTGMPIPGRTSVAATGR